MVKKESAFLYRMNGESGTISVYPVDIYTFSDLSGKDLVVMNCDRGPGHPEFREISEVGTEEWEIGPQFSIWTMERDDEKARKIFADKVERMASEYRQSSKKFAEWGEYKEDLLVRVKTYGIADWTDVNWPKED